MKAIEDNRSTLASGAFGTRPAGVLPVFHTQPKTENPSQLLQLQAAGGCEATDKADDGECVVDLFCGQSERWAGGVGQPESSADIIGMNGNV